MAPNKPKLVHMQMPQAIKHGKDVKDNLMHSLSSIKALSEGRPIMLDMAPAMMWSSDKLLTEVQPLIEILKVELKTMYQVMADTIAELT